MTTAVVNDVAYGRLDICSALPENFLRACCRRRPIIAGYQSLSRAMTACTVLIELASKVSCPCLTYWQKRTGRCMTNLVSWRGLLRFACERYFPAQTKTTICVSGKWVYLVGKASPQHWLLHTNLGVTKRCTWEALRLPGGL
jgi:hypothetical protein